MRQKKKDRTFKQERNRIFKDNRVDTYRRSKKLKNPVICTNCGAFYSDGRWSWDVPFKFHISKILCPACQRIKDHYPAGYIEVEGEFLKNHKDELLNLIHNQEAQEMEEHPLELIIEIKEEQGKLVISTTGMHLPGRIGNALKNSYEGKLDISYEAESIARAHWMR